jgi:hypothetical protein
MDVVIINAAITMAIILVRKKIEEKRKNKQNRKMKAK